MSGFSFKYNEVSVDLFFWEKGPFLFDEFQAVDSLQFDFDGFGVLRNGKIEELGFIRSLFFLKIKELIFGKDAFFGMKIFRISDHFVDSALRYFFSIKEHFVFFDDGEGFELELLSDVSDFLCWTSWGFWGFLFEIFPQMILWNWGWTWWLDVVSNVVNLIWENICD